jgi:excisionase family DNA binding protein
MNTERFLTLAEVRQRLAISKMTLWRWRQERGLREVRVGGCVRVRESDLEAFLNRHEQGGDGEVSAASASGQTTTGGKVEMGA